MNSSILALTSEQIYNILDKGYHLDDFFYAYFSSIGDERYICFKPNLSLVSGGKLTAKGYDLISIVAEPTKLQGEDKKSFELLWQIYPIDNGTSHSKATRMTKGNKDMALKQYKRLLNEHTHNEIYESTKLYIEMLYLMSTENKNELEYLPNLSRFLEEKRFLGVTGNSVIQGKLTPPKHLDPNVPDIL